MAHCKPINFFLRIGNDKAHDLESMREHFHLDLVYDLYTHGILARWLDVHGYNHEKTNLEIFEQKFQHEELNDETAKIFCKIFLPDANEDMLCGIIETFKLCKKWCNESKKIDEMNGQWDSIINDYHSSYDSLKQSIVDDSKNMPAIKAHLYELSTKYFKLFAIDYKACLDILEKEALIAILMMYANPVLRNFLEKDQKLDKKCKNLIHNSIPKSPADDSDKYILKNYIFPSDDIKIISNIKYNSKYTHETWDDIEPYPDKQYMILQCTTNQFVRSYKNYGGELSTESLQYFPIVNGIEYSIKSELNFLIYMEV